MRAMHIPIVDMQHMPGTGKPLGDFQVQLLSYDRALVTCAISMQ